MIPVLSVLKSFTCAEAPVRFLHAVFCFIDLVSLSETICDVSCNVRCCMTMVTKPLVFRIVCNASLWSFERL